MAKFKVKYPTGITVTKYVTTDVGTKEITKGKVKHFGGTRYYYKPALGALVIRKSGVERKSEKVRAINKLLKETAGTVNAPAVGCGGLSWDKFVKCLGKGMTDILKPYEREKAEELGAEEFEKRFSS